MLSREVLLVIGVIFHIVYLFSIFDIYFTSPLIHGARYHQSPSAPPADRVVLIVGDGLHADKLFELDANGSSHAPYLRHVIKEQGTWGISHTRIPTETKTGHLAIISGVYKSIGAIPTRWSKDLVHFDSVFNQSRHTWSFGSPDIVPMFQREASNSSHVDTSTYSPKFEVFSGDASYLDTWVFDHVKTLFHNATSGQDTTLDWQLRQNKTVFFLHLLGIDTNGHAHRPYSKEYYNNIALVDRGVKAMVDLFESYYGNDGRTSYIFTADHGMSDRGAHGDGHPNNTRTPIVAWGAGIRSPILTSENHDITSTWGLDQYKKQDILQADIAPLMAHLIGIPYPANSVGQLPLDYLDADNHTKAESALTNAMGILDQYQLKNNEKQRHGLFFTPFSQLSGGSSPQSYVNSIQELITSGEYSRAVAKSNELADLALNGLHYLQTYHRLFLRIVITIGFVGWCVYSLEFALRLYANPSSSMTGSLRFSKQVHGVFLLVYLVLVGLIWIQRMPPLYYAYALFPVFFWNHIIHNYGTLQLYGGQLMSDHGYLKPFGIVIGTLLSLETLVYSFFDRQILSVVFILVSFWPLVMPGRMKRDRPFLLIAWTLCCWCTSIFTTLPVDQDPNIMLVIYGGLLGLVIGFISVLSLRFRKRIGNLYTMLLLAQLGTTGLGIALVYWTSGQEKLSLWNKVSNWAIVCTTSLFPFIYRGKSNQDYLGRLLTICFAFAPLMILLSICYEMLFYVSLCTTLLVWLEVEYGLYRKKPSTIKLLLSVRPLQLGDLRPALYFLFFMNVGFFGTGNVASLNSFTLESVYRFITMYDSFVMGSLLITKVLIPFFVVASVFSVLTTHLDLSPFSLFLCVVTMADLPTIHFFYLVSEHGSWLDISTNISHYCIAELFTIITIVLFFLSQWLVGRLSPSTQTSYYLQLQY